MLPLSSMTQTYIHACEYQKNLDAKTIRAYRADLRQFICFSQDAPLNKQVILDYIEAMHSRFKPKTVKRKIASIKAFFNYLVDENVLDDNPFSRLKIHYKEPLILPKTVSLMTIQTILRTMYAALELASAEKICRSIVLCTAILELLFATGMRVSELCNLGEHDVDIANKTVRIYGKGARERVMQIENADVLSILQTYKELHQPAISASNYFFVNRRGRRCSEQSVRHILSVWAKKASIPQHITPHMIRHSFATLLLEEDVDIRYIQQMLGHSAITTTQIYTHVASAKQKQILSAKHPRNKIEI